MSTPVYYMNMYDKYIHAYNFSYIHMFLYYELKFYFEDIFINVENNAFISIL